MTTYASKRLHAFDVQATCSKRQHYNAFPHIAEVAMLEKSRKKLRLTQTTIDLGTNPQKTCKTCGMSYVASNAEDFKLHKQYHAAHISGICIPKQFWAGVRIVWRGPQKEVNGAKPRPGREKRWVDDSIVEVCRRDSLAARNLSVKILRHVEEELGAVQTSEEDLWGQVPISSFENLVANDLGLDLSQTDATSKLVDRFKVYMYIQNNQCIGLCLAERIKAARTVLPTCSSNLSVSDDSTPGILGISRIWVSGAHRNNGIGKDILEATAGSFLRGIKVDQNMIAFSQPTESGTRLAIKWFGKPHGWLVYA